MKKYLQFIIVAGIVLSGIYACEKDITVDLPHATDKIVVEGVIEEGQFPYIILTQNSPYFSKIDVNTLGSLIVTDALVTVNNGSDTDTLQFAFTPNEFPFVRYKGDKFVGERGKSYELKIEHDGDTYESLTTIPESVPFDSTIFRPDPNADVDSVGFIWLYFSDPIDASNHYRTYTMTEGRDSIFVHPFASVLDDKLTNGKQMVMPIYRGDLGGQGAAPTDTTETDSNESDYMFKAGETVYLKLCTMDADHYRFWQSYEQSLMTAGNPFAAPSELFTNIEGGALGVWGGYGVHIDTLEVKMPGEITIKKAP